MGVRGEPHKTSKPYDRVNPLSHTPGGVTVRVIKWDGYTIDYPNVKYPKGFKICYLYGLPQNGSNRSSVWCLPEKGQNFPYILCLAKKA